MTLTKKDIVERLHATMGLPRQAMSQVVAAIFAMLKEDLLEGGNAKIANFGVLKIRKKNPRPGRNMRTGEQVEVSARSVVTFKPSRKLRDALKGRG